MISPPNEPDIALSQRRNLKCEEQKIYNGINCNNHPPMFAMQELSHKVRNVNPMDDMDLHFSMDQIGTSQQVDNQGNKKQIVPKAIDYEPAHKKTKKQKVMFLSKFGNDPRYIRKNLKSLKVVKTFIIVYRLVQMVRFFQRKYVTNSGNFALINDKVGFVREIDQEEFENENFNIIQKLQKWIFSIFVFFSSCFYALQKLPAIQPTSYVNLWWMLWQFFFNSIIIYYASIYLLFEFSNRINEATVKAKNSAYSTNIYLLLVSTMTDIMKGMNTGYYQRGTLIMNKRKIASNYLRSGFIYDFLSLMSVVFNEVFFPNFNPYFRYGIQFFFFFKIHNLFYVSKCIDMYFTISESFENWMELIQLIVNLLITGHIIAIIYHGIAMIQIRMGFDNTWLHQANMVNQGYITRYIVSIMASVCSMVSFIIYVPETMAQMIFITMASFINCGFFGYAINELQTIMQNIERPHKNLNREIRIMQRYLAKYNLDRNIQNQVRSYLEYMHEEEQDLNLEETSTVINKLSRNIKNEIVSTINRQYINKITPLKGNFSDQMIERLYEEMVDEKYIPGDNIYKEKESDDLSIYYIISGQIEIYNQMPKGDIIVLKTLVKGQYFGQYEFFTLQQRQFSTRASAFCHIIQIPFSHFQSFLNDFPEDKEKYQQIKDDLLYNELDSLSKYNIYCYVCGQDNHMVGNCNCIHGAPFKRPIMRAYSRNTPVLKRTEMKRFKRNQHNSLRILNRFAENYDEFMEQNDSELKKVQEKMNLLDINEEEYFNESDWGEDSKSMRGGDQSNTGPHNTQQQEQSKLRDSTNDNNFFFPRLESQNISDHSGNQMISNSNAHNSNNNTNMNMVPVTRPDTRRKTQVDFNPNNSVTMGNLLIPSNNNQQGNQNQNQLSDPVSPKARSQTRENSLTQFQQIGSPTLQIQKPRDRNSTFGRQVTTQNPFMQLNSATPGVENQVTTTNQVSSFNPLVNQHTTRQLGLASQTTQNFDANNPNIGPQIGMTGIPMPANTGTNQFMPEIGSQAEKMNYPNLDYFDEMTITESYHSEFNYPSILNQVQAIRIALQKQALKRRALTGGESSHYSRQEKSNFIKKGTTVSNKNADQLSKSKIPGSQNQRTKKNH